MPASRQPVLILGAGVNGAALARELLLNRVPVVLVDTADACSGASAYSSRLIHGGLRYLEFGEWDLVRESPGRLVADAGTVSLSPFDAHAVAARHVAAAGRIVVVRSLRP